MFTARKRNSANRQASVPAPSQREARSGTGTQTHEKLSSEANTIFITVCGNSQKEVYYEEVALQEVIMAHKYLWLPRKQG